MIVADTGPLIALARIGQLDLLRRLYGEVLVPPAVVEELALGSGRPGAALLERAVESGWLVEQSASFKPATQEPTPSLGRGETEAIVLAAQKSPQFLLIDDARGRRTAHQQGLPTIGVAGVLLLAKGRGEIDAVKPFLDGLSRVGYRLSGRLVSAIRRLADE